MSEHDDKTAISSRGRAIIVVADDDQRKRMTLRLEEDLFAVRAYASGEDCVAKGGDFDPDVIVLDLEMIETCRRIKQLPALQSVPLVFLTGPKDDDAKQIEALAAGGNDFLSKDASGPVLIARLACQVTINRMQRQLVRLGKK